MGHFWRRLPKQLWQIGMSRESSHIQATLVILSSHPQSLSVAFIWSWIHILSCIFVCLSYVTVPRVINTNSYLKQGKCSQCGLWWTGDYYFSIKGCSPYSGPAGCCHEGTWDLCFWVIWYFSREVCTLSFQMKHLNLYILTTTSKFSFPVMYLLINVKHYLPNQFHLTSCNVGSLCLAPHEEGTLLER